MTGYGTVARTFVNKEVSVTVRSVNNRYLDIFVNVPVTLSPFEGDIKKRVSTVAQRGKVEVFVQVHERVPSAIARINVDVAAHAWQELTRLRAAVPVRGEPTFADLCAFEGVLERTPTVVPEDQVAEVMDTLDEAILAWENSRVQEGSATGTDIRGHLQRVIESAHIFAQHQAEAEERITDQVRTKFHEILGDAVDEQRVYTEIAALLLRHGTHEEIARLESHIDAFGALLKNEGPVGKRLDFICQEMNREINTTGSKATIPAVQRAVVEAKDAVEAIREQLRNVE